VERDPGYMVQIDETIEAVADRVGLAPGQWSFAFQSAGHTPEEWLKPDLTEVLSTIGNAGSTDVLVVPVGGKGLTLDAEGAAAVVAQLEPGYVVPVHYDDGVSKYPMPQDGVDLFLKEMGVNPEPESKLRVNSKEAPTETQVVVLTRAGS